MLLFWPSWDGLSLLVCLREIQSSHQTWPLGVAYLCSRLSSHFPLPPALLCPSFFGPPLFAFHIKWGGQRVGTRCGGRSSVEALITWKPTKGHWQTVSTHLLQPSDMNVRTHRASGLQTVRWVTTHKLSAFSFRRLFSFILWQINAILQIIKSNFSVEY